MKIHDIDLSKKAITFTIPSQTKTSTDESLDEDEDEDENNESLEMLQVHSIFKELKKLKIMWHPQTPFSKDHYIFSRDTKRVYMWDFSACGTCNTSLPHYVQFSPVLYDEEYHFPHLQMSKMSKMSKSLNVTKNEKKRIGIFIHVGSIDVLYSLQPYIDNLLQLQQASITFLCSTYHDDVQHETKRIFNNIQNSSTQQNSDSDIDVIWIPVKNRGMDLGGFLESLLYCTIHKISFDYILKLHTKSDGTWRTELCEPLLKSVHRIQTILNTFDVVQKVGCAAAEKWILSVRDDSHNHHLISRYCHIFNLKNPYNRHSSTMDTRKYEQYFVGGTIFWIRGTILHDFVEENANLIRQAMCHFEEGYNSNETETHTHSFERLLGMIVYHSGHVFENL